MEIYNEYIVSKVTNHLLIKNPYLEDFPTIYAETSKLLKVFASHESFQNEIFLDVHAEQTLADKIQRVLSQHGLKCNEEIREVKKALRSALIRDLYRATGVTKRDLTKRIGINKKQVYDAFSPSGGQKEPSPLSQKSPEGLMALGYIPDPE